MIDFKEIKYSNKVFYLYEFQIISGYFIITISLDILKLIVRHGYLSLDCRMLGIYDIKLVFPHPLRFNIKQL